LTLIFAFYHNLLAVLFYLYKLCFAILQLKTFLFVLPPVAVFAKRLGKLL